jgi:precorrin-6A/cobalt-precorrin-6A reductase
MAGVPLVALERPAWERLAGDNWLSVASINDAVTAIGTEAKRAFLALGRQELLPFEAAPQHLYLIRSVDPVEPPLDLPNARYVTARGPFELDDEQRMLTEDGIEIVVSKNSGGSASYGKIEAARRLGLPVIMIERPLRARTETVSSIDAALVAIHHHVASLKKRGE